MGKYSLADLSAPTKHHVKGEPFRYKHGWIPVGGTVESKPKLKVTLPERTKPEATKAFPEIRAGDLSSHDARRSRAVSSAEFQRLATEGKARMGVLRMKRSNPEGLDRNWTKIKDQAWAEVQKSWGGLTVDSHTGKALPQNVDAYSISVKAPGVKSVSIPETSDRATFEAAMEQARRKFKTELGPAQSALGVFHDDDNNRIDIDPVLVVDNLHDVETIGAYTHAVGGAYHFASGDGFWPPHVAGG